MGYLQRFIVGWLLLTGAICNAQSTATYIATVKEQLARGLITKDQAEDQIQAVERKVKKAQKPAQVLHSFTVTRNDTTLEDVLRKWSVAHKWTILNKGMPLVKLEGEAELKRESFLDAAEFMIEQARAMGFPVSASAYSNNVLVLSQDKPQ